MKKFMHYLIFCFIVIFSFSCKERTYIKLINRLDQEYFEDIRGFSVHFRSSGRTKDSSIYVVNSYNSTCSPYFVEVSNKDTSVNKIDRGNILENCYRVDLTEGKLRKLISAFLKYDVTLLIVDNEGNVFLNPYRQERPILIKKNTDNIDTTGFRRIKGQWYLKH